MHREHGEHGSEHDTLGPGPGPAAPTTSRGAMNTRHKEHLHAPQRYYHYYSYLWKSHQQDEGWYRLATRWYPATTS